MRDMNVLEMSYHIFTKTLLKALNVFSVFNWNHIGVISTWTISSLTIRHFFPPPPESEVLLELRAKFSVDSSTTMDKSGWEDE